MCPPRVSEPPAHPGGGTPGWRAGFVRSIRELLQAHPRLSGVHINIEPWPSGNKDLLLLLDEVRAVMPPGKLLSVAAYPPPTRWPPYPEVHWEADYYREVSRRTDQLGWTTRSGGTSASTS